MWDGGGGLTYEAVGEELVNGGESEACDWSGRVLGTHHFQERPQEHVGLHIRQLCRDRQRERPERNNEREKIRITKRGGERKTRGRLNTWGDYRFDNWIEKNVPFIGIAVFYNKSQRIFT